MSMKKVLGLCALLVGISTMGEANAMQGGAMMGAMQGGSPKCCAAAFRGNPQGCNGCCQRKWQNNQMKKQRCFANCQMGHCPRKR